MFTKLAASLLALSALVAPALAAPTPIDARYTNSSGLVPHGKRANAGKATWYGKDESDPHFLCDMLPNNMYTSNDMVIVALRYPGLINNQNKNEMCGRYITVEYQGKTVTAQVVDGCASCTYDNWIDLSPGAISQIDPSYKNDGEISVNWWWADGDSGNNNGGDSSSSTKEKETSTYVEPTSTWTPPPEPTSTWTPPPETSTYVPPSPSPSPTPSETSTTVAPSSTSVSPSSSLFSSLTGLPSLNATMTTTGVNASITSAFNLTSVANATTTLPYNATASVATVAIHNATATVIAPDAIITTAGSADGTLASLNNLVASLGRIIVAAAS